MENLNLDLKYKGQTGAKTTKEYLQLIENKLNEIINYVKENKISVGLEPNNAKLWVEYSYNLFNKDDVVVGYINADGTINASDGNYRTSNYIQIKPNTDYYKTTNGTGRSKFFDANKNPLNTSSYQDISLGANAGAFTTPANAHYVRVSLRAQTNDTYLENFMLSMGSTALPYNPYIKTNIKVNIGGVYEKIS